MFPTFLKNRKGTKRSEKNLDSFEAIHFSERELRDNKIDYAFAKVLGKANELGLSGYRTFSVEKTYHFTGGVVYKLRYRKLSIFELIKRRWKGTKNGN